MLCEGSGIPLSIVIDRANRHDMKLVGATIEKTELSFPKEIELNLCMDKGYDYFQIRSLLEAFGFTLHIRSRGEEKKLKAKEAHDKARRWVVERTHSWLNNFRRILVRWERKAENYLAMLHLACGIISWRRSGLLG